jgi:site-specific DNA-cytosine methylase
MGAGAPETRQRTDDLLSQFARMLGGVQPRAFVLKNVPGLAHGAARGYFIEVRCALEAVGYDVAVKLIDASRLGVPQARRRLIFVGLRHDLTDAAAGVTARVLPAPATGRVHRPGRAGVYAPAGRAGASGSQETLDRKRLCGGEHRCIRSSEVRVRPPEVFVRALEVEEARKLKRLATDGKHRSTRIRAMILLASATEMAAPQIARLYLTDAEHVRKVIHAFSERGFGSLDADCRGGRPSKVTPEQQRDEVVSVARARPDSRGVALTRWSIDKLARTWPSSRSRCCRRRRWATCSTLPACRFMLPPPGLSPEYRTAWISQRTRS